MRGLAENLQQENVYVVGAATFLVFQRLERAMKESKLLVVGGEDGLNAHWDGLHKYLPDDFLEDVRARGLAPAMLADPPRKQIQRDNVPEWKEMGQIRDAADLILAVRRVRNNLVHGGKYMPKSAREEPAGKVEQRDRALLLETLTVLDFALDRWPELGAAFDSV
ncbi:hypothetical protein [Cupriavidus necator]|uniref:hypothetical protein n=1 Tax=Cupriavidus necator TaxID=106590 RepID=UPI003F731F3B